MFLQTSDNRQPIKYFSRQRGGGLEANFVFYDFGSLNNFFIIDIEEIIFYFFLLRIIKSGFKSVYTQHLQAV